MSMKKHGNKEAKKPKQAKPINSPAALPGAAALVMATAAERPKRKK